MPNKPIERFRLSSLKNGAHGEYSSGIGEGLILSHLNDAGGAMCRVVARDSAGRRKVAETTLTLDALLRLHHSIGEALKAAGLYAEVETDEQRNERLAAEAPRAEARVSHRQLIVDHEDTIVAWGSLLALGAYLIIVLLEQLQCIA